MIREPGICVFSFRIFVRCLLQMEEQRPARMPVHSDMLGHAICVCLALYCSPLGHSLFLRDIVVTLHRTRAHTTVRSAVRPRVAPHAHTASGPVCAKRNAQRVPRQLGVAMGAGAAMRRGPALILTCFRGCVLVCASHCLRHGGKVQGPPKPETAAPSPLGVVCSVPALTATSSDARVAAYLSGHSSIPQVDV